MEQQRDGGDAGVGGARGRWKGGPVARQAKERLEETYRRYFDRMGVDPRTGKADPARWPGHRFGTWPFVGSRYGEQGHRRILFVGMQWGHDPGHLQSSGEVQDWIERSPPPPRNHYLPGTCIAALRWLPARYGSRRGSTGALPHLHKEAEEQLLMDDILECYRADVVLFQSPKFCGWPQRLRDEAARRSGIRLPEVVRVLYHPSNRKPGGRSPRGVVRARC